MPCHELDMLPFPTGEADPADAYEGYGPDDLEAERRWQLLEREPDDLEVLPPPF